MTVRDIATAAGLSLRQLAIRFEIPYRTVQDWAAGKRTPPPYVLRLLEDALTTHKQSGLTDIAADKLSTKGEQKMATTYVFARGSQYGDAEFLGNIDTGCEDLTGDQIADMRDRYIAKVSALVEAYDSTLAWYPYLSEVWGIVGRTESDPDDFQEWWEEGNHNGRWESALLEAYDEVTSES